MRMIPAVPYDTDSDAERQIFEYLREIDFGPDAVALHSLSLSDVQYRLAGEIDFVIVCRDAVLILEVKGGGVKVDGGIWSFTNRYNRTNKKRRGPFKQAEDAVFKVKEELDDNDIAMRDHLVVHGVCFPDIVFNQHGAEWPDEIIFDLRAESSTVGFASYLRRLIAYWRGLKPNTRPLSAKQIAEVVGYLRPSFEVLPSISSVLTKLNRTMDRLTEDQCAAIDATERFPRLLCEGGAGTGKTFIAVYVARQMALTHRSVALVVSSPLFAAYLGSRVGDNAVRVFSLAEAALVEQNTIDALVVDEGQDLMNPDALAVLDNILDGGIENGPWRFFLDPNAQSGLDGTFDREAYDRIAAIHPPFVLKRNCRNTQDIVLQTRLVSGADLGVAYAGDGPPVQIHYWRQPDEAVDLLRQQLYDLHMSGVRPSEITILSPYPFAASSVSKLETRAQNRIVELTPANAGELPLETTTFATVRDFKGLENSVVIATDLDRLSSDQDLALFYVAMSRARGRLIMNISESLQERLKELQLAHLKRIRQDQSNERG